MYLKSIELENFKSFGGKVTIPLMDGYMAVTGPNGSGKSNIGDAIMFVLGPRSPKAVRAARIPDLVFSNAGKGKADYMKATLVFENTDRILPWDSDEVRLTRHVKLKGENKDDYVSYFYINGQPSKLAEFEELLSKARISADGYNIVQQGDVTHIIQMGAMERRRILDGISGISSFDADLEKAGRERTEAETNLGQISIIRTERASSLERLEKQRADAIKYNDAKKRVEISRAQLSVRQRDSEKEQLDSLRSSLASTENDIDTLTKKRDADQAVYEENEKAISDKETEIETRSGPEYVKIKGEVEQAKINLGTIQNVRQNNTEEIQDKEAYIQELSEKIEENRRSVAGVQENLADLRTQLDDVVKRKAEADAETERITADVNSHGGEMTAVQTRIQELESKIDEQSAAAQDLQADAATAQAVSETADLAKSQAEDALEAARFDVKNTEDDKTNAERMYGNTDIDALGKQVLTLKNEERTLEKRESDLREIYMKKQTAYNKMVSEKRAMESVSGGGEAYNRILAAKASGEIRGIHGAVCELATVDDGFDIAISVAAGSKARSIVVDNKEVAAECIRYLKANGLKRVTFLPLAEMQPGRPSAKAIMMLKQTLGYATDFIHYDKKYDNIFWYVFGDTLVTPDLDKAKAIMGQLRIVTKSGELIEKSSAMTGGTLDVKNLPKFGSAGTGSSDIADAGADVQKANDALVAATESLRAVREKIRETDDLLRAANKSGAEGQGKIAAAQVRYEAARNALAKAEEDMKKRSAEADEVAKKANDARVKSDAARESLEAMRAELTKSRERLSEIAPADLQQRIAAARELSYTLSTEKNDLESQVKGAEVEIKGLQDQSGGYSEQIAKVRADIEAIQKEIADSDAEVERLTVELEAKKKIQRDLEAGQENLRAQRDTLIEKRYKVTSAIEASKTQIEVKSGIAESQRAAIRSSEDRLAVLESEVAALGEEIPANPPSEETIKRNLRQAEAEIEALGTVNPLAVEEYDRTLAELNQLDSEVESINARIASLTELEEDISAKKKGIFMEAYNAIDANFKTLFAELSGGGEASMSLEDPDDPFNGGLFINAKPRNGMMLRLEALSGGEKSLTALAFIFAIQEYQPSPFYVLDEVDMFLDAVNTELVASHIKTQSGHTQFIQVSLRKVALTKADNLIGVTRPPSGISKIIMQVDMSSLDKLEAEAQKRREEAEKTD
ncbi:MAG: chromosome segregation protein SMC [Thermoplasmata archaeon]|nr:chromosome segregation protein SMC [Thermoplasmata archaeon]